MSGCNATETLHCVLNGYPTHNWLQLFHALNYVRLWKLFHVLTGNSEAESIYNFTPVRLTNFEIHPFATLSSEYLLLY
jgi:hypothetical protein